MSESSMSHRGYTLYQQPQGGVYICGLKVVVKSMEAAVSHIDDYLQKNDKARQESLLKEARKEQS